MNILLTTYIHPIETPIKIFSSMGFVLDNPKTIEEIDLILENLRISLDSPDEMYKYQYYARIPINSDNSGSFLNIKDALKRFKSKKRKDSIVKDFFVNNYEEDVLTLLAKMWVVARFNDEGEIERLTKENKRLKEEGNSYVMLLAEDNPINKNSNRVIEVSYLLSLLLNNDPNYIGGSFVLFDSVDRLYHPVIDAKLNHTVMMFAILQYGFKKDDPVLWKAHFPYVIKKLSKIAGSVEKIMDERSADKVIYISEMLKNISEDINDLNIKLVLLVSLIEMMLTHNPDFNRYNVEDSINKQFQLKASVLIYMNNKNLDLNILKNKLKNIYSHRSNIAHGNFNAFKNWVLKEAIKMYKDEDTFGLSKEHMVVEGILIELYFYVRSIVQSYIDDRNLVDFIKDN